LKYNSLSPSPSPSPFLLDILAEQGQNTGFWPEPPYFPEVVRSKLGPLDAELNSAYNTDRWRECQEEISESAAHFTDFIHVPRFRDGCSKFVGKVRNFFLLHAYLTVYR
jgi:hypothetical protein